MRITATPTPVHTRSDHVAQVPQKTSLTLGQILDRYQINPIPQIVYQPKVMGIKIPFIAEKITQVEAKLIDTLIESRGLLELNRLDNLKEKSRYWAYSVYPSAPEMHKPSFIRPEQYNEWTISDGHQDAFRHAFWSARLVQEYGLEWAKQFTTAHEGSDHVSLHRTAMDLYNNQMGFEIAQKHPKSTPEELVELIMDAISFGELVVIDSAGQLAWSNLVDVNQHGLAQPTPPQPGKIPVPAGNAQVKNP